MGAVIPLLDKTGRLVARALKTSPEALLSSLRPATLADLPQILSLRAQVFGTEITWDDEAYLSWRYGLGRAGQGAGECWVVVLAGELLGLMGTEDITLRWGGITLAGVRVMDTLIRPDLSDVGLGVWLSLVIKSRHALVLAVGANATSKGLVTRVFDVLPNRRILIHPIRFDHFMAKRTSSAAVAWVGARLASSALSVARAWTLGLGHKGIRVSRLPDLPQQLDRLLQAAVNPDLIEVVRSRAHWAWRLSTPRSQFDLWGAWVKGDLVGLMITRRDAIEDDRLAWTVMDLVTDRRYQTAAAKALLWSVIGAARGQQVEYLIMPSYRRDVEGLLHKAGFVEQPNELKIMAWSCQNDALRAHGEAGADWSFNEIHSDGG